MRFAGRRQFLSLATAVVVMALVFPSLARAQSPVDQFIANPAQALQNYPNGGAQLISLIRDVAVGHPEALNAIIALLANANANQQSAIGSGLGQAAQIVVSTNPDYANQIQQAVAAAGSENASTAFASVTGNVNIAATGPGGGGGGTGGGGGVGGGGLGGGTPTGGSNTGGGGTTGGGSNFANNGTNSFTGGGTGGGNDTSPR